MTTIKYEYPKGTQVEDLQAEVEAALRDYETNKSAQEKFAKDTGHAPEEVRKALDEAKGKPIEVKQQKAGVGAVETILIAVATQIAKDLWTHVALPWIRKKFGPKVCDKEIAEKK